MNDMQTWRIDSVLRLKDSEEEVELLLVVQDKVRLWLYAHRLKSTSSAGKNYVEAPPLVMETTKQADSEKDQMENFLDDLLG